MTEAVVNVCSLSLGVFNRMIPVLGVTVTLQLLQALATSGVQVMPTDVSVWSG